MVGNTLSIKPFRHERSDDEWNLVVLGAFSQFVDQLETGLFDIESFSIEVEVLVGFSHLII